MIHGIPRAAYCVILAISILCAAATLAQAADADRQLRVALVLGSQVDDKAFNDLAIQGLRKADRDFGVNIELILLDESPNPAAAMTTVLKTGYDLLITEDVGAASSNLPWLLTQYPQQRVAHLDGELTGPNVLLLRFASEDAAFLAGAAAAMISAEEGILPGVRGTHTVGFVGGTVTDTSYLKAFEAGARHVDDKVQVLSSFAATFSNAKAGQGLARLLHLRGADVVAHAAGRSGLGVLRAAAEGKFYAIGADADQDGLYPGAVLTSMVKRIDLAVYEAVRRLQTGAFAAGVVQYSLANGGLGLTDMSVMRRLHGGAMPQIASRLEALAEDMRAGRVQPPRPVPSAAKVEPTPSAPDIMQTFKELLLQEDISAIVRERFADLAALRVMGFHVDDKWDVPAMRLYCKDSRQLALLAGMYQADLQMDLVWGSNARYSALLRLSKEVEAPLLKSYLVGLVELAKAVRDNGALPDGVNREGDDTPTKLFLRYCGERCRQWFASGASLDGLPAFMDLWCGLFLQDAYVTLHMALASGNFSGMPEKLSSIYDMLFSLSWMLDRIWIQPDLRRRVGAVWFRTILQPLGQFMREKRNGTYSAEDIQYMLSLLSEIREDLVVPCN